ncbi:PaaI family thioesterase [bacterium]|nr:PaaI family thioesterase [bacterium]MBP9810610.1 PaaI family thioesterase [bacterium]
MQSTSSTSGTTSTTSATKRRAIRGPLTVQDENFEEKIRKSFEHQGVMHALGGTIEEISLGYVEVHLPFSKATQQQHGFFHGGIVAMLADTASGFTTYTVLPPDEECLSAEFKVNFLYPANGSKLIGRGGIIKVGKTLVIAEATVSVIRGDQEIDCAYMIHTLARTKHVKSGSENKA